MNLNDHDDPLRSLMTTLGHLRDGGSMTTDCGYTCTRTGDRFHVLKGRQVLERGATLAKAARRVVDMSARSGYLQSLGSVKYRDYNAYKAAA